MKKLMAFVVILLLPTSVLADTDAEDALAAFIILNGHGCPDVKNVQPMGNDTSAQLWAPFRPTPVFLYVQGSVFPISAT